MRDPCNYPGDNQNYLVAEAATGCDRKIEPFQQNTVKFV